MSTKLKFSFVFCLLVFFSTAQQKPYYTQVIMNNYILNPALSGIENYTDVKLSYRNQWTKMNGAPVTTYLSVHGPIGKKDFSTTATSFGMKGENPRGKSFLEEYTVSPAHQGVGLIMINDKTGFLNRFTAFATYAYHKPLTLRTALSAGFQVGVSTINLDKTKAVWGSLDPNDPAIGYDEGDLKKTKPELGAGIWLYSANYFIGASVLNVIPGKVKFVNSSKYGGSFDPHFFATAGYRVLLNENLSLLPSVGFLYVNPQPAMLMANAKLQYRDLLWMGLTYRYSDVLGGFAAMAGVNISNTVNISYSYDNATTSRLKTYVGNTHEVIIGFLLGNAYGDTCPKNVW
jgi:type IX secretion system PorP/SprF family membrane protein